MPYLCVCVCVCHNTYFNTISEREMICTYIMVCSQLVFPFTISKLSSLWLYEESLSLPWWKRNTMVLQLIALTDMVFIKTLWTFFHWNRFTWFLSLLALCYWTLLTKNQSKIVLFFSLLISVSTFVRIWALLCDCIWAIYKVRSS